ncbi:hypothetical protein EDC56_2177 [Sinobacterium caligoides]|uniref:Uncharacterized protein n=1 Tax=Sinobacterium caligoides TaxID=933926 RepID=A0A3N2DPW8_9GAMM|nr:hypothetical protein [Sinobacterium caligoides]ROS01732.1 hypothetical protein EDC56_2177 [Sinobacterium caligoides]
MRILFLLIVIVSFCSNGRANEPPPSTPQAMITLTVTIPARHYIAAVDRHLYVPQDSVVVTQKVSHSLHYKIVCAQ